MPILSGTELAEIIQRELPEICFIIISGYQDFEYARTAMRAGVIDYLLKPIVPSEFSARWNMLQRESAESSMRKETDCCIVW